jgi:hypothetical protein
MTAILSMGLKQDKSSNSRMVHGLIVRGTFWTMPGLSKRLGSEPSLKLGSNASKRVLEICLETWQAQRQRQP